MNCEQVKEHLSLYLDNALAAEEQQAVAHHLTSCHQCNAVLADFRHHDRLLAHLPRISPDVALREKLFSSPDYLELTGTSGTQNRVRRSTTPHSYLVSIPGGRSSNPTRPNKIYRQRQRYHSSLRIMQGLIAASILLTLSIGALIGWTLWEREQRSAGNELGITPPAGINQGPLPAGLRFIFLRDGALWSVATDGGNGMARLTPPTATVATRWAVRPGLPNRPAGNMLAYIDLQQGFVHTLRSDGQSDTVIPQPLLKQGVRPSSVWDTEMGAAILNGLAWSKDGSMLAFVADPGGQGKADLYIYTLSTQELHKVALPAQGSASRPVWSPDSIRIAFQFNQAGKIGILDYNVQNHGLLTITDSVGVPGETLLTLDWTPNNELPTITWSVGKSGTVQSIWQQQVGVTTTSRPTMIANGLYSEAAYSKTSYQGAGGWLLVTAQENTLREITMLGLNGSSKQLTNQKQARFARWSPDGTHISYFDAFSSGSGTLHIIDVTTGSDSVIAQEVINDPAPAWSVDGRRLAYSTSTHILIVDMHALNVTQPIKLQGSASAFSWSASTPQQLVLALSEGQQGLYLVDLQQDSSVKLDKSEIRGPILWTYIP